jgi:hypothetical protein
MDIQRQLGADERLLWSGQPKSGLKLRGSDAFLIPFSILWAGFAVFWEAGVIGSDAPFFFMLWGIPFILVGLYFTVGRFFVDAAVRAKTSYGVTNQRVVIIRGLTSRKVTSLSLRNLQEIGLEQRSDGSGTITFGPSAPFSTMYRGVSWPGMDQRMGPAFDMLPNVKSVYDLIQQTQRSL